MVDGYSGFLFLDSRGLPEVALHWEKRFNHMVGRYNEIYKVQMPNITPHIYRHTYCTNMARSGMNPKTLQYLMGHSDISITMNTYTHLGLDDARDEMIRMEELEQARKAVNGDKVVPISQDGLQGDVKTQHRAKKIPRSDDRGIFLWNESRRCGILGYHYLLYNSLSK